MAFSTGHVAFASRVDVHLFQDDQRIHFQVQEDARWDTLRHFWQQDGQVLQWPQMLQVVHMLSEQAAHVPNTDSPDRDSRLPMQNQGTAFHPLCQSDSFAMWWPEVTVLCADQKDRVPTFVATWFLSQGESAVCLRHRRVKVHRSMSFVEFQQACRMAWQEILNGNSLHFSLVEGDPPSGFPSTVAHVIIVQGGQVGQNAILLQGNNLPPLTTVRAVLFDRSHTIAQVFQIAQFPDVCLPHRYTYQGVTGSQTWIQYL